uniref:Ras-related protein Rab-40C n=1 Tax=Parascaris equorum TaxID=6256 RepID=A0A914RVA3_PAREQ
MVHRREMILCRNDHEYLLKFLLVGDSDVGKNEITDLLAGTSSKTTTILLEGRRVRLQLWDTSGQGRFSTIIRSYSRGAQGILLVYDITNRWSFEGIRRWLAEIDEISALVYFNVHESLTELARLVIQRNGMHWLWRTNQEMCMPSSGCLCQHSSSLRQVRSFAQGAEVCMGSLPRRHTGQHAFSDVTPRHIARLVRPRSANERRSRNAYCSLM